MDSRDVASGDQPQSNATGCHLAGSVITMGKRKPKPAARTKRAGFEPIEARRVSPRRAVPDNILLPPYARSGGSGPTPHSGQPSDSATIDAMRAAGSAARRVLRSVAAQIAPGVTTDYLDEVCHEACIAEGGYPSPLGYPGPDSEDPPPFPKSLCTSVNEIICHGIPDDRPLRDGDIVNCDVTIYVGGVHGDHSETFLVGEVDEDSRRLVEATREAMYRGIAAVRPGARVSDIGRAIEAHADAAGYGVVREFVGHGIAHVFHGPPSILHYYDRAARTELVEGWTFTVEPMITLGQRRGGVSGQVWDARQKRWQNGRKARTDRTGALWPWSDGWTVPTEYGNRTAQFEHTVLVTADGTELLTVTDDEPQPFLSASVEGRLDPANWPAQLPTAAVRTG